MLSLLLFFSVNAQNVWYVDKDATGNGNASSWDNAATSLSSLPWGSIGDTEGDTIYVSGGSDSLTYVTQAIINRVMTYEVVVTPAHETGAQW